MKNINRRIDPWFGLNIASQIDSQVFSPLNLQIKSQLDTQTYLKLMRDLRYQLWLHIKTSI